MLVHVQATVPADIIPTPMAFVLPARQPTVQSAPTISALNAYPNPCKWSVLGQLIACQLVPIQPTSRNRSTPASPALLTASTVPV